jgi:hypothetical protein
MGCSFGGLAADDCAASPATAEPGQDVAIFMPMASKWAMSFKYLFYFRNFNTYGAVQKLSSNCIGQTLGIKT